MIIAMILTFFCLFGVLGIIYMFICMESCEERTPIIWGIIFIIILLVAEFGTYKIAKYEEIKYYESYIEQYKISQKTIEQTMSSDLSDLEKIDLSSKIRNQNIELADKKIKYSKWYYWYIDKSKINELEYIEIGE